MLGYQKREPNPDATLPLRGPYPDQESYQEGLEQGPFQFPLNQARNWTGSAAFPLLPAEPKSVESFKAFSSHPSLEKNENWSVSPCAELNAGTDKKKDDGTRLMHFTEDPPEDYWPVYKGSSFNLWDPDTGDRYAWADPDVMTEYLQEKRKNSYQYAGSRSSFSEMSEEWVQDESTLPCYSPRIVFRDVARSTDSRTVLSSLIPANVFLTDKAPYLLWAQGDKRDEAYLLGILSSIPLDWYARRFVETSVAFHIFNSFPIPRPGRGSTLRQSVVELSGRLAAVDDRYEDWANEVGVGYGPLDEDEKQEKIHELDAVVAHLYGLSRENLEVVFETFHDNWDHEPRMNAVLEHYDEWAERLEADT